MAEVRKAIAEDFEKIYPLLYRLNNQKLTKEDWQALFFNHWKHEENYFGFVLEDNDKIAGYLGAIFSTRLINGQLEKICNLSTWVVDEAYKKQGLSLFLPVLELEEYTITNFSSADKTYIISKKLGFEDIGIDYQAIFLNPFLLFKTGGLKLEFDKEKIETQLKGADKKIFEDHIKFNCIHVLASLGEEQCYIILKETPADLSLVYYLNRIVQIVLKTEIVKNKAMLGHVHYISNKPLFVKHYQAIVNKISFRYKIIGLIVDQHSLGVKICRKESYKTFATPIFKSTKIKSQDVDSLYSEFFILNM